MISRRRMLALLAGGPGLRNALAAPQADFTTGVKIVSLLVTVRDRSGHFVNELDQGDFVVEEDGRPQTISYFSRQDDLPLTLGLLVDISGSQREVLPDELAASDVFFKQVLREGVDQAFLVSFATRAWLMQNVTVSRDKLQTALGVLACATSVVWAFFVQVPLSFPERRLSVTSTVCWGYILSGRIRA